MTGLSFITTTPSSVIRRKRRSFSSKRCVLNSSQHASKSTCLSNSLRASLSPPSSKSSASDVSSSSTPSSPSSPPSPPSSPQQQEPKSLEEKRRDVSRLLSLFGRLALPYWRSEKSARRDLIALLVLALLQSGVSVVFSYIQRDFWTALNTRDVDLFYHQAQLFFGALAVATPVVVYYQYLRDGCSLRWRNWITSRVVSQYCTKRNFYFLESDTSVDNPDQRISQDLNSFTTESIAFILTLLVSSVDLVCFSVVLFSIYPLLFVVLLIYAASGTIATAFVGKELISLNYQQLVKEANLRYSLVRMRENAESIAFFQGEKSEESEIMRRLSTTIDNMMKVINLRRRLSFLQTGYRFSIQVLPSLVVAPRYFAGDIQLGSVTQSFSAFSHILNDLSLVVNRFDSLSQFGAGIDRLAEFVQALERNVEEENRIFRTTTTTTTTTVTEKTRKNGTSDDDYDEDMSNDSVTTSAADSNEKHHQHPQKEHYVSYSINRIASEKPSIKIKNLTLVTPGNDNDTRRKLVEDLSLELKPGNRLLVSGPSGSGKSTILRAIAGLWESGYGTIECPEMLRLFFLPQKPYCTLGTLRANLIYPSTSITTDDDDEKLLEILKKIDLEELPSRVGGLDAICDWSDMLSLGEQQRLQFGRLLYRHESGMCDIVVIDEGSSALSVSTEQRMYEMVKNMNVAVVSVGHRPTLLQYHDLLLRPNKDGKTQWEISEIDKESIKSDGDIGLQVL